jgi:haloalkane dehalogenase
LSDKPQQYPYTLDQHIENLVHLVDALDLSGTTLVAHDWGGPIGLGALLRRRQRFASLVLLNTGAFPPPYIPWRIRLCRIPVAGSWAVRGLNLFARAALSMAMAHPERLTRAVRDGLLAPYDSWAHRIAIDRFVKDIPASRRHPTWETLCNLEDHLANLTGLPSQLIWGMRDWCFRPECLRRLEQLLPEAQVTQIADAGHYVMEDASEQVITVIRAHLEAVHGPSAVDE